MAEPEVGVDTVAVVVPNARWILADGVAPPRRTVVPGGGCAYGQRNWAVIEASLPKREYGHNVSPLPLRDLRWACERLIEAAEDVFEFADPTKYWLNRIDLSRNFRVDVPISGLLAMLAAEPQPKGLRVRLERSTGIQWQSLYVARASWLVRLYDKFGESGRTEATDVLRLEVELRKDALRSKRLKCLGGDFNPKRVEDWTASRAEAVAHDRFEILGLGRGLHLPTDLLSTLHGADLSPEWKAKLLYFETCRARGLDHGFGRCSRSYEDRLKSLALEASSDARRRIDWHTGRLSDVTT